MATSTIPAETARSIISCRQASSILRKLEFVAEVRGLDVAAWPAWKVGDAGVAQFDLLEFALRSDEPAAFASLVDLGFHFHWPLLSADRRKDLEAAFENAIEFADTGMMLDVESPDEKPDAASRRLARRSHLSSCLTEALVIFLRRAPEAAREEELERLGRVTLLDGQIMQAVKSAHERAAALRESAAIAESMAPIEEQAREAAGRLRL